MRKSPPLPAAGAAISPRYARVADDIITNVFDFYGTLTSGGEVIDLQGPIFSRTAIEPHTLSGQRFNETVFWQTDDATPGELKKAIEGKPSSGRLELPFRVSADETVRVRLTVVPYVDDDGSNIVFIGGQAVVDAAGSNGSDADLLAAAKNAGIGLWIWDFETNHIRATPTCNELLNVAADATLSRETFLNAVHHEDRAAVENFLTASHVNGEEYSEEFRVVSPDGAIEWISAEGRCYCAADGTARRLMGVLRQVTSQKMAAQELAEVYVRETKARNEAVDANRAKDFFLAFVSHELRSPLNAILGWSKILLTKQVDDETRTNALRTIEKSAKFQTKLIDDLVDSARVASGKLKLEYRPANLYEIINSSFQAQTPAAAAHNIEFTFVSDTDNIPIFGDAGRLQQVFGNLLSNAIKFTPDNGRVSIDIETGEESVTVLVSDTGQGIEKDALPNIFRQFSQGDISQARRNYGLGLGLSIVNILVAKHGGTVTAESEGPGSGSVFRVVLPLSTKTASEVPEVSKQPHAKSTDPRPLRDIRILIVEDDVDSREVLHLFLEQSGAVVESTESAAAAMQALGRPDAPLPDIIISDLAMPDEDGYSLIARIRKLPAAVAKVPAMALSAFATAESKKRAADAGFDRYATKPFEPEKLVENILELTALRTSRAA